jgi:phospholipid/cholesterol/gamma-HCH transport system substrate-binding protein
MKDASAAIKVGLTALIIALLSFFAFKFVSKGLGGGGGYRVWALFHDATGLVDKSQVQVAGLNIGEISDRSLDGALAKITIRVKPEVKLWSNATVFKKSASLLGQYYLEIDPGTPESPEPLTGKIITNHLLKDGDQIKNVVEAITVSDILVQVNETLPVLRQILLDIQKLTQGPVREIAESVKSGVDRNVAAAEKLLGHLDQIALDVRGMTAGKPNEDLRATLSNMRQITEGVKQLVGTGEGQVSKTGESIQKNLEKVSVAIDNLNHTMANVSQMSDKINSGQGTVGRLLNDDTIANNVEQITDDVRGFVGGITRLQTLVGLRSEYNVVANGLKTYVSVQLQSRPDKFFLIQLIDDPRGTRSTSRTFTTTDDPSKPQTVNTVTVTTQDKFRFSFEIGKTLFLLGGRLNLTGRFGIIESTGGIGMDLTVPLALASSWFRTLTITADLFDFRGNTYPRLKVWAALEFFRHIWVTAGVDDILNDRGPGAGALTGRDYFFGLQLTFNDDDLRALLTIGGAALIGAASK